MHQHDQDLIMALAEGTLDAEAAAAARAEVESCPQCAHELELQSFALSALDAVPQAQLTEFESAKLRRDVRNELGVFKEEVRFEPTPKRRRFPIAAFATAAAVLIAVVAVAPRLSLVGGGDSADTVALDVPQTTFAASAEAPELDETGGRVQGSEEDASFATAAPTTAAPQAATTTTAVPPEAVLNALGYYAQSPDLDQLRSSIGDLEFDEESARRFALRDAGSQVAEQDATTVSSCIEVTLSTGGEFVDGFQFARGTYEGREVIFYVYLAEDPAESAILVQAADNCEELARAGP